MKTTLKTLAVAATMATLTNLATLALACGGGGGGYRPASYAPANYAPAAPRYIAPTPAPNPAPAPTYWTSTNAAPPTYTAQPASPSVVYANHPAPVASNPVAQPVSVTKPATQTAAVKSDGSAYRTTDKLAINTRSSDSATLGDLANDKQLDLPVDYLTAR